MAAPVFVSGSKNNAAITTGTSATVSSTGTTPLFGNLQIVFVAVGGASRPTAITPPAGWNTLLATTATASSSPLISVAIFWRTAPATAAFSGSFSWTGTATSGEWLFTEWAGQGPLAIDGAVVTSVNATSTTPTSPTITPANGRINDTLVCALIAGATGATTITIPGGMSSVLAIAGASGTELFGCASLALASASATGTKTWTLGTTTLTFGVSFLIQQAGPFVQELSGSPFSERSPPLPRQLDFVAFPNIALLETPVTQKLPRAPLFTPKYLIAKQFDFQFPNVALEAFSQLRVKPVGAEIDETVPQPPPHQLDFQFRNVALEAFAQLAVRPVGGVIDETKPLPPPHQLDFQFPNIVLPAYVKPVGVELDESRAVILPRQLDFQFPNLAALNAAQLTVSPVGAILDETRAVILPRQLDFQFPNLAAINAAQLTVSPVGSIIDESKPRVDPRQLDFAFPNLAVQLNVVPVGKVLDETVPSPQARQLDFAFPNVSLQSFAQLAVKPIGAELDETRPVVTPRQLDFQFPNIAIAQPTTVVAPTIVTVSSERPALLPQQLDFVFPNIALPNTAVVPPVVLRTPLFTSRPFATLLQIDAPLPNLLTTTLSSTIVINPPILEELVDVPAPQQRVQDVISRNTALLTAVVVKPVGGVLDETVPKVQPRQLDFQFPNIPALATAQLQVKPVGSNLVFDRPIATSIPTDAPVPNILLTTLSVVQAPLTRFLFEQSLAKAQSRDFVFPNLLAAIATPPGVPFNNSTLPFDRISMLPLYHLQDFQFPNIVLTAPVVTKANTEWLVRARRRGMRQGGR